VSRSLPPILYYVEPNLKLWVPSRLRFSNRSARFIDAYGQGLSGAEAAWANRRYHGHRSLPPEMAALARAEVAKLVKN